MTIGLKDIRFKPLIIILFLATCVLISDGIYRIEKKLVIKTYYQQAPGELAVNTIYLQKDGTLVEVFYCDICENSLTNGTWKKDQNHLILNIGNKAKPDTLIDYTDSLVYTNGSTAYYNINFWKNPNEK